MDFFHKNMQNDYICMMNKLSVMLDVLFIAY